MRAAVLVSALLFPALTAVPVAAYAQQSAVRASAQETARQVFAILAGEIAANTGHPGVAYTELLKAAKELDSEPLYRRAAEIALRAGAPDKALIAAQAWRKAMPGSREAGAWVVQLFLLMGKTSEAGSAIAQDLTNTPEPQRGQAIADLLKPLERPLEVGRDSPTVIMVVGVNGAGKTTSIGKLTRWLAQANCKVLLAAADTFRAAAREQLLVWAGRNQVEIVAQQGGDPAAVSFDAVVAGKARGCDVVIADTAGRLPTQTHLMEELKKIRRTITKAQAGAPHEVLLVVDGNTGQNALAQVKAFDAALGLTGLVVTKLDGTAKGGVLAAIARWGVQQGRVVPVYFIGVGETMQDLQTFSALEFAQARVA